MASYYNRTRSPITVSLNNGQPALVPPKSKLVVSSRQDGSASLHAMVRRGYLVRLPVQQPTEPAHATIAAPTEEERARGEAGENAEEPSEEPSMTWTKNELLEHADDLGLEVSSSMTKKEILDEIEGAQ